MPSGETDLWQPTQRQCTCCETEYLFAKLTEPQRLRPRTSGKRLWTYICRTCDLGPDPETTAMWHKFARAPDPPEDPEMV